jgi:hypothetical protein
MTSIETRIAAVATAVKNTSFRAGLVTAVAASTARHSLFGAANALERGLITAYEFVSDFSDKEIEAAERWLDGRMSRGLAA